jgi:hypothetical protein
MFIIQYVTAGCYPKKEEVVHTMCDSSSTLHSAAASLLVVL